MYVPIMKNRDIEVKVIKHALNNELSSNVIPLIEVVQEKSRTNLALNSFSEEINALFEGTDNKFFIDIVNRAVTNSVKPPVQKFITENNRDSEFSIRSLLGCSNIKNCIPVLSYHEIELLDENKIKQDVSILRDKFKNIAIRLYPSQFISVINFIFDLLKEDDYFMFDIQKNRYDDPKLTTSFNKINKFKGEKGFKTILIVDSKPVDYYNVNIVDGQLIEEIDVSYLNNYKVEKYGAFDGIADYVGIGSGLPTNGGATSPAGIYFSMKDNKFVGYKYREGNRRLSEFADYIAPEILKSEFWKQYSKEHHDNCRGCKVISGVNDKTVKGGSQGVWKGVTMSHYVYTLDEFKI